MSEARETQDESLVIECDELPDSSAPFRQGDVLEWLGDPTDPWERYAIVMTADCDLAHDKHGGVLACVPVLPYADYLALFPLPARLRTAETKLFERAVKAIRDYQAKNRPEFPVALSDQTVSTWIEAVSPEEIVAELRITEVKQATRLVEVLTAIKQCSAAEAAGGFGVQLDALTQALLISTGEAKSNFAKRREALIRDMLDRLRSLPGDAVFLHALSPRHRSGYVAYLRASFFVHASDGANARRLVFPDPAIVERLQSDTDFAQTSLQRAHQMTLHAERLPLRLNPTWSPYHHKSFVAFLPSPGRWAHCGGSRRSTHVSLATSSSGSSHHPHSRSSFSGSGRGSTITTTRLLNGTRH